MSRRRFVPSLLAQYFFLLSVSLFAASGEQSNASFSGLDTLIRNRAFLSLPLHRTGHPYRVHLPSNLSAVTAVAVRLRGADLWLRGAGVGSFHLPPGIFTGPYARRMLLVFYDLGNLSASYFSVSGHVLIAPVMVCLAYDASNATFLPSTAGIRELSLQPTRDLITIAFSAPAEGSMLAAARCVQFMPNGSASVGAGVMDGMRCTATGTGHFSVVVPVAVKESRQAAEAVKKEGRRWLVWVWVALGCGAAAAVGLGLGLRVRRVGRKRRFEEMEKKAEEGEVLDRVWVGGSKMPAAVAARTQPVIESEIITLASAT
ncbi:hypothetical protein KSP39_PZI011145 [Platanthera zijinensis]|uniref:Uncharacterized protein n=1 Tax=Platanthera zijinensis TaxID=2320716 RepID=A0AAP0BH46_9ASPA